MKNGKPLIIIGFIIGFIGLILHIVGLATTGWSVDNGLDFERGPYRFCNLGACGEMKGGEGKLDSVRAMTILGMIFAVFGAVANLAMLKSYSDKLPYAVLVLDGLSFLCIILGIIIWAAGVHRDINDHQKYYGKSEANLGWSFALSTVGGVLILIAGNMGFYGGRANLR